MPHHDCLIVDDEREIAQTISEYFNMFDVSSAFVTSYDEGLAFLTANEVSLLILDINLGEQSGFQFCKEVRKTSQVPVIFISARDSEDDILSGLAIGGDDFITKPFSMSILLAKVRALLKRLASSPPPAPPPAACAAGMLKIGDLHIGADSTQVYRLQNGVKVQITLKPREWRLLLYFIRNPHTLILKDELLREVWQDAVVDEGTLSVHIRRLREKLESDPNEPTLIKTVWGSGYFWGGGESDHP